MDIMVYIQQNKVLLIYKTTKNVQGICMQVEFVGYDMCKYFPGIHLNVLHTNGKMCDILKELYKLEQFAMWLDETKRVKKIIK